MIRLTSFVYRHFRSTGVPRLVQSSYPARLVGEGQTKTRASLWGRIDRQNNICFAGRHVVEKTRKEMPRGHLDDDFIYTTLSTARMQAIIWSRLSNSSLVIADTIIICRTRSTYRGTEPPTKVQYTKYGYLEQVGPSVGRLASCVLVERTDRLSAWPLHVQLIV